MINYKKATATIIAIVAFIAATAANTRAEAEIEVLVCVITGLYAIC